MSMALPFAETMMRRALDLAKRGTGSVEPNPAVGAVIVNDDGQILGEGWHQKYGGPHAEVHAIAAAGAATHGANLFVTLEPCCHYGKTPPCSKAVIAAGLKRVFVAMRDPAPHVDGGGIAELRAAGIEVEVGLLETEAQRLVAPFVQMVTARRSWFHAKWAMTLDGRLASRTGHSQWITNAASRAVVHQLRGRMDAILVGIGTALADDPLLTARPAGPRIATRIVVDSKLRLPVESQLAKTVSKAPVLVVTTNTAPLERIESLHAAGAEVLVIESDLNGRPALSTLVAELGRRRLTNVLIEGGSEILGAFFDAEFVDEVHAFIAPKLIGGKSALPPIAGIGLQTVPDVGSIDRPEIEILDGDVYIHGPVNKRTK